MTATTDTMMQRGAEKPVVHRMRKIVIMANPKVPSYLEQAYRQQLEDSINNGA